MKVGTTWIVYSMVLVAIFLRVASEATANVSFFLLAFIAICGVREAVQALALSWLFSMINPGLTPDASLDAVGRYLIVLAASFSVFVRYKPHLYQGPQKRLILYTLGLGLFLLVHSMLFSAVPGVSVLKAISWTLTFTTLLAAWGRLERDQQERLVRQIFFGLTIVMLLSLPLIATALGYLRNGSGFQGVLSHPQAFGPAMSLLGVWAAMNLLALPRPSWNMVLIAGACLVLIVMSEARTAGFAFVGGIVSSLLLTSITTRQKVGVLFPGLRSARVALVLASSAVAVLAFAPQLSEQVSTYISKRSGQQEILEAYKQSRGGLIDPMWKNIEDRPLTGIGFGIASKPAAIKISTDPFFDFPVGAPVEKGVLPIAVVEEIGLPGFFIVLLWGWAILRRSLRGGGVAIGVLAGIALINFGEATLFSPGGMGMLSLVLLGWVATLDQQFPVSNRRHV